LATQAFARVWTGWDFQPNRGNIMQLFEQGTTNNLDPMRLNPERVNQPYYLCGG
jgi:hypothetical protein